MMRVHACVYLHAQALSERTNHKKEIDLEELGPDSPLCSMLVLEALRAKGGPLHTVRPLLQLAHVRARAPAAAAF
jgi:hypothetical protein